MKALKGSFTSWVSRANKLAKSKGADNNIVKYCLQRAYFDSDDLAESFRMYSQDICGRKLDSDRRLEFFPFCTSGKRNKMIQAARGSWKSSICVVDYATWRHGRDFLISDYESRNRTLFASEVLELARRNMRWALRIMRSKRYMDLVGDHKAREKEGFPWGVQEMVSAYRKDTTLGDPSMMPMGANAERTGFHFDLILCDDLEAERSSATSDMIENCWDFFRLLFSILDPKGEIQLVGTRWHSDDIYARIEEENETMDDDEKFDILKIPAKDPETKELNFPAILSEKKLDTLKKRQGNVIFSCQYDLNPVSDEDKVFDASWVKPIQPYMLQQNNMHTYVTADFAWTVVKKQDFRRGRIRSDWTVILTVSIDEDWNYIITDWFRDRCSTWDAVGELYRQWEVNKAKMVILQKYDSRGVSETLEQYGYDRGLHMPVEWIAYPPEGGKAARIANLVQPRFKDKKVYMAPNMIQWILQDEVLDFPRAKHDDALDALCNVIKMGKPPARTKLKHRLTREQREVKLLKAGIDPVEFFAEKGIE